MTVDEPCPTCGQPWSVSSGTIWYDRPAWKTGARPVTQMPEPRCERVSTDAGPDYCKTCSTKDQTWVKWPCRASVVAVRLAEAEALLRQAVPVIEDDDGRGLDSDWPEHARAFLAAGDPDA